MIIHYGCIIIVIPQLISFKVYDVMHYPLTAKLFNLNFHPLEVVSRDAIHNFKWVKIIQIWQNGGQLFSNLADWCHILSLTYLKCDT